MDIIKTKKIFFLLFGMIILGTVYYATIWIDISKIAPNSQNFSFTLHSTVSQNVNFHIKVTQNRTKLSCNGQPVLLDNTKKHDYFYRGEEQVSIVLKRGKNLCQAEHMYPQIAQKIDGIDFVILFILWATPFFTLIFFLLIKMLNYLKRFVKSSLSLERAKFDFSWWIGGLIVFGLGIRIAYFEKYGIMLFQHDWHGHIEYIKYVAEHGIAPAIPMKGWEFPQQPLYYFITGGLYGLFIDNGFSDQEALHHLGYFSLFCSAIFLYYSYALLQLLSPNRWVHGVGMIFITLTPSIVYLSARINNDALVMALSTLSLYLIIKSYQSKFQQHFFVALVGVSLLFFTKISTMTVEFLFLLLLVVVYLKNQEPTLQKGLEKKIYIYGLVGIWVLGLTLFRIYMPLDSSFYVVNAGKYPGQILEHLDMSYFGTFNILELIQAGQSHITGEDRVRHSFLTYLYGTMFFGEFDYAYFIKKSIYLASVMPMILILGLMYLLGLVGYIIKLWKEPILDKMLLLIVLINLMMVIRFVIMYPSICHTDFRFFVGSFTLLAFIFAKGLEHLTFNLRLKKAVGSIFGLLVVSELLFFGFLIY